MNTFDQETIETKLSAMVGWKLVDGEIQKVYTLKDFNEAIGFVVRIAIRSEAVDHHPDILIQWNKVTITLSTHNENGLTEHDFNLAADIDGMRV